MTHVFIIPHIYMPCSMFDHSWREFKMVRIKTIVIKMPTAQVSKLKEIHNLT